MAGGSVSRSLPSAPPERARPSRVPAAISTVSPRLRPNPSSKEMPRPEEERDVDERRAKNLAISQDFEARASQIHGHVSSQTDPRGSPDVRSRGHAGDRPERPGRVVARRGAALAGAEGGSHVHPGPHFQNVPSEPERRYFGARCLNLDTMSLRVLLGSGGEIAPANGDAPRIPEHGADQLGVHGRMRQKTEVRAHAGSDSDARS